MLKGQKQTSAHHCTSEQYQWSQWCLIHLCRKTKANAHNTNCPRPVLLGGLLRPGSGGPSWNHCQGTWARAFASVSNFQEKKSLNQCDPWGRGGKVSAFIRMPQSYLGLQVMAWNKAHSFFPEKLREEKLENILKDFSENICFREKPSQTLVFPLGF